jgi:hypothetical protein
MIQVVASFLLWGKTPHSGVAGTGLLVLVLQLALRKGGPSPPKGPRERDPSIAPRWGLFLCGFAKFCVLFIFAFRIRQ